MSSSTFVTVTPDEIRTRNNDHWFDILESLGVPLENEDDASLVTAVMPYAVAYTAYQGHLESCGTCATGELWDECPEGDRLSGIAADAMAAQGDLALQN